MNTAAQIFDPHGVALADDMMQTTIMEPQCVKSPCDVLATYPATKPAGSAIFTQTLQLVDTDTGNPIVGAHVKDSEDSTGNATGAVSDQNGNVTVRAFSSESSIVFSHQSYGEITRKFDGLGSMINLTENSNSLPSTTIVGTKNAKNAILPILLGVGGIFLLAGIFSKDKKKSPGLAATKSKKRKTSKKRKSSKKRKGLKSPEATTVVL